MVWQKRDETRINTLSAKSILLIQPFVFFHSILSRLALTKTTVSKKYTRGDERVKVDQRSLCGVTENVMISDRCSLQEDLMTIIKKEIDKKMSA